MDLASRFFDFIKKEELFQAGDKLYLAVSGGLDSTVLLHLCYNAGYDITLLHVNFQLRGEESERDEKFVRQMAASIQLPVEVLRVDAKRYAAEKKISTQAAARVLRYEWFESVRLAYEEKKAWILTAHHLDDNIETSIMHWVKGTGIRGIRGILPKQGAIIRPLLLAFRNELLQYANEHQLQWVEDSSNESDDYTRNFLRHQVMPLLEQMYPSASQNLAQNLQRFREVEMLYQQSIDLHRKSLMERKGNEWHIPVLKLKKTKPLRTVFYELIREFGFLPTQLDDGLRLLEGESGRYIISSTHRIIRNRNWLIVAPKQAVKVEWFLIEGPGEWTVNDKLLTVKKNENAPEKLDISEDVIYTPANLIQFPLLLRKPKMGDYFYPFGMRKKKKLARFFIDQKLSRTSKENVWVLEMKSQIIWLPGLRLDDRFRITAPETACYEMKWMNC